MGEGFCSPEEKMVEVPGFEPPGATSAKSLNNKDLIGS